MSQRRVGSMGGVMTQRMLPSAQRCAMLALAAGLLLAACQRAVLDPAGDIARQQRDIIYISTGLMLLIIVPVMILIVVFAWRYRKGKGGTYDPDFDHSTALELVIWSAPLLIIIALGALTWSSTHLLDPFRPLDRIGGRLRRRGAAGSSRCGSRSSRSTGSGCSSTPSRASRRSTSWCCRSTARCASTSPRPT